MNSTLSWTAVLNQNGGWRLGAHQGSLHYTAPDRGNGVERSRGEKRETHRGDLKREGRKKKKGWRHSLRWETQQGRKGGT